MLCNALPPSYATTRAILLDKEKSVLTVDRVTKSVLAEEANRKGQNALALKARADVKSKSKGKGKGGTNGERPKCTNPKCGKVGHTIHNCWAEGGGAEGKGPKPKPKPAESKPGDAKSGNAQAKVAKIEEIEEVSVLYSRADTTDENVFVASERVSIISGTTRKGTNKSWVLNTPVRIWVANGHSTFAEGIGCVYLD